MKPSPRFFAPFVFCCACSLLLPRAASCQDFSSIDSDLQQLESLIQDTLSGSETQQQLLEDLRRNLDESGNLLENYGTVIAEQENLLRDLRTRLTEMSEIYRTQSLLSAKYEKSSRFWKTFTLLAVPLTALLSGALVLAITN